MALLNITAELDSKPNRFGTWHVMLRLYKKGCSQARIRTGIVIPAKRNWNPSPIQKKGYINYIIVHPNAEALNVDIAREITRIREKVVLWEKEYATLHPGADEPEFTPKQITERLRNGIETDSYFDLASRVVETSKEQAYRTYQSKLTALTAFSEYAGEDLTLQAVTSELCERFQIHLKQRISKRTGKRLKPSTINQYFDALHVIHQGVMQLKGVSKRKAALQSPWLDVEKLPAKSAYKSKLTEEQIEQVKGVYVLSRRRRVTPEDALSVWLLSHTLAGARISDTLLLRYRHFETDENGQAIHLTYVMLKTGTRVSIPIFEEGRELLARWWNPKADPDDFLLPYLKNEGIYTTLLSREAIYTAPFAIRKKVSTDIRYWNAEINKALKEVQQAAGLKDKLTSHNARHSFADLARRIMQQDKSLTLYDIQLMLGHGQYSTTVGYMEDLNKQDATEPMKAVFGRKKKTTFSRE